MTTVVKIPSYPSYPMKLKGVVLISPLLAAQIIALRNECGATEWSGMLLFRPVSEDLMKPDNFRVVAEAVYPMDIGDATYTEYEFSPMEVCEMYERYPQAEPPKAKWKLGHIHSHHTMKAFFSGTDNQELVDNVEKYEYYLSLIVSDDGKYAAKVAFLGKTQRKIQVKAKGQWKTALSEPETVMATFECEVKMMLDEWFDARVQEVAKDSKSRRRPVVVTSPYGKHDDDDSYRGYGYGNYGYGSHSNQHSIGFRQGTPSVNRIATTQQKAKENEKENKAEKAGTNTPKNANEIRSKIRSALPYLLIKDEKEAKTTSLYYVGNKLKAYYTREDQENGYAGWVAGRFDSWLKEHLADELKHIAIDWLAEEANDQLHMFGTNFTILEKVHETLKKKIEKDYGGDGPKDDSQIKALQEYYGGSTD